ncbi:hypothetical protein [Brevundimonas sp.]|uniref:hypothetical protein n=1 Tax=Brevundimonas sp. TaxID=1871086 RepID=UPI0028A09B03|nr:hypothetical protein [Brevundimonas sp.]
MHIEVELDYETGDRAGAGGTFQVISLTDDDGNDVTEKVDQGRHFTSIAELEKELSQVFDTEVAVSELEGG